MTENTVRAKMPTQHEEWMFELIVALKDQIEDLRMTRDAWMSLALFQHKESGEKE